MVLSCTVSEILRVFCAPDPPIFHPNFDGVPIAPDRPCWGQQAHLGLIFELFQFVCKTYLNVTDRQTPDGQTQTDDLLSHNRALRIIAR